MVYLGKGQRRTKEAGRQWSRQRKLDVKVELRFAKPLLEVTGIKSQESKFSSVKSYIVHGVS